MNGDLEKLFELLHKDYKITSIHISINKKDEPHELAELSFEKDDKVVNLSSSEEKLFSYVIRLHSIPHIEDDGSDFVYIEEPNRYFELQKRIIDLICGTKEDLVICEKKLDANLLKFTNRVVTFEKNWILSEKGVKIGNTKLCQIFYDVGVFYLRDDQIEFELLSKERINLSEVQELLTKSGKTDLAICFSAFVLTPSFPRKKNDTSDVIVGIIIYDLKNRQTLSFNINSLNQLRRRVENVGKHGLWECIFNIFERTKNTESFRSYLPLPLDIRDFTPLPWFCFAFLRGLSEEIVFENIKLDLSLFLAFGTPLLLLKKPSYSFDPQRQVAFIMLGFRQGGRPSNHQVRFDMSEGEPKLHVDYQVFPENKPAYKIIGHSVLNYTDIWDFDENLAISFLLASAYDIKFDNLVVPHGLSKLDESFRNNPLTVYPLFVRSMVSNPFKLIKGNMKLFDALFKTAKKETITDYESLKKLEAIGLVREGLLTLLGNIVYMRLLQTK